MTEIEYERYKNIECGADPWNDSFVVQETPQDYYEEMLKWRSKANMRQARIDFIIKVIADEVYDCSSYSDKGKLLTKIMEKIKL